MRKITVTEDKKCPRCEKIENQIKTGRNRSGTQRCKCKECGASYTIDPKKTKYSEEIQSEAINMYRSGVSGRGVGRHFGFSPANVHNWIKKAE
jgi:transposase-like protein